MKYILGKKQYMTQVFDENGTVHPATVISAGPIVVTQVRSKEKDGYVAVQVGYGETNPKRLTKAEKGHFGDKGSFQNVREFRHSEREPGSIGGGGRAGGRVIKGMRMAGRMGNARIQVKNLTVLAVDPEARMLVVSGAVPGRRGTLLEVRG
ncbi:MAG: 50S ribosomal protein L3 [Candidatus Lloydbacteria bacterium]|nr:50S ribosomal protein L3 [Candidatus Lloydbacteria bacterium]